MEGFRIDNPEVYGKIQNLEFCDLKELRRFSSMRIDMELMIPDDKLQILQEMDKIWVDNLNPSFFSRISPFGKLFGSVLNLVTEVPGRCGLWLVMVCEGLLLSHPMVFFDVLQDGIELGLFPRGEVLVDWIAQIPSFGHSKALRHLPHGGWHPQCSKGEGAVYQMMRSKSRFSVEEKEDYMHVHSEVFGPCTCEDDLICEHGFSARYALTVLRGCGKMVGMAGSESTIDFNAFFEDVAESTVLPLRNIESRFHVSQTKGEGALRTPQGDVGEENVNKPEPLRPLHSHKAVETDLLPEDSSSNMGRYERRYMHPGTVLATKRGGRGGVVSEDLVQYELPAIPEVVVGFVKTSEIARKEVINYQKVAPINGLARPFENSRLNFLCHLHTAIVRLAGTERPGNLIELLRGLSSKKSLTPTNELLIQVVKLTFDWDDMEVSANPFKLPYIEPHMLLSNDCLLKCLDLLWREYEIMWFDQMKSLSVPSFAFKYQGVSDSTLTNGRMSRHKTGSSNSSSSDRDADRDRRHLGKRGHSVLGLSRH